MNWLRENWIPLLAWWFIIAVVATPFIGSLLHKRRVNRESRWLLARSKECARQEKLLELADAYDNAPTDKERQRIFRRATELGFTDDARPFALDEDTQPHFPKAS